MSKKYYEVVEGSTFSYYDTRKEATEHFNRAQSLGNPTELHIYDKVVSEEKALTVAWDELQAFPSYFERYLTD